MLNDKDLEFISNSCEVQFFQAKNVIELFDEGMTVPFISRYRKEKTGSLDELKVNQVKEWHEYIIELNERKQTVLTTIESQGKLTDELKNHIINTYSKTELEDIYLPYKPKRRTKATIAKEKGLEPLAVLILDINIKVTIEDLAKQYINEEKGVKSIEDAIQGAGYIIAEWFSENADVRKIIRKEVSDKGNMIVSVSSDWEGKRSKFEQYYDYKEPINSMPSHRILAVMRGEEEKVLRLKIDIDNDFIYNKVYTLLYQEMHPRKSYLDSVYNDSYERLIFPSIETEIRSELKKRADEEAIKVFASNLEKLLLSPPAGNIRVMGVDPGFRTGCKIVVLDETGKLIDNTTIYPTKPEEKIEQATNIVKNLIEKHKIQAIAIGNGTASRETKSFFKSIVSDKLIVTVISEAGASVYSASEAGREEFPDFDVTVRGAISIGRRFQDPLAELVKIDPKSIGVGQYQHDVNQSLLKKKLDSVVVSVVNRVGVDLNTASYHILKYISGIGETLAKNIVSYRDNKGMYKNRTELLNVTKFGNKAFEQSAGFLRISNGNNILDLTGIHPESYEIVQTMAKRLNIKSAELIRNKESISKINPQDFVTDKFGIPTINDIIKELENPGRDPRQDFELFDFTDGVEELTDLKEGMVLKGVVTNVTNFGAFVDIGVHQDGLVHISEMSHNFIKSPEEVVSVGDKITVKVIKIDPELKRINLSIKALIPAPQKNEFKNRPNEFKKKVPVMNSLDALKKKWGSR